jgi:thioredoxin 1
MGFVAEYSDVEPSRIDIDAFEGLSVVEFSTAWCEHCIAAQPFIAAALEAFPQFRHVKIEDGPGRLLGRSFRVKLWPTLVVLKNGSELGRLVRPNEAAAVESLLKSCA